MASGINFEISVVWLASQCWSAEQTAAILRPDVSCVLSKLLCLYARLLEGCNARDNHIQYLVVNYSCSFELAHAFHADDDNDDDDDVMVTCYSVIFVYLLKR